MVFDNITVFAVTVQLCQLTLALWMVLVYRQIMKGGRSSGSPV